MKLETIKAAISEWNYINDYVNEAFHLLNQGVLFGINPKVLHVPSTLKKKDSTFIHAYPGVIDGELKFFLINAEMDKKEHFDNTADPITNYIFVEDVKELDEKLTSKFQKTKSHPKENISPEKAKERISRWNLAKKSWIKNQINNTEGLFEAFVIPTDDLKPNCDIYAFLALANEPAQNTDRAFSSDEYTADLIIWNNDTSRSEDSGLDDLVAPVPPFGRGETSIENFTLLNESLM